MFIDSVNIKEITHFAVTGILEGATSNPTLLLKEGNERISQIQAMANIVV